MDTFKPIISFSSVTKQREQVELRNENNKTGGLPCDEIKKYLLLAMALLNMASFLNHRAKSICLCILEYSISEVSKKYPCIRIQLIYIFYIRISSLFTRLHQ